MLMFIVVKLSFTLSLPPSLSLPLSPPLSRARYITEGQGKDMIVYYIGPVDC